MPIVQIDWERIKGRLDDVTAFYALTHRQASLLSSLTEQLTWKKTFQVNDYDWADKDALDADIADLESNLQMPVNLVDIIGYIDEIEDLLRALEQHAGCCDAGDISDGANFTDPVTDGEGDVPQNIIDAGYAEDSEDWEGFADYKCMVAHVSVDQLEARTREIAAHMDQDSTTYAIIGGIAVLTGIITHIFTAGLSTLTIAILTSLGATSLLFKYLLDFELMEDLADDVATNHDELACAFYNSDGVDDAISNLKAKISELFSGPQALVLLNLNITPTVKALYAGRYDQADIAAQLAAAGYDTADFDCTCPYPIGEHQYFWDGTLSTLPAPPWQQSGDVTVPLGWNMPTSVGTRSASVNYNGGYFYMNVNYIRWLFGYEPNDVGTYVEIHKVSFWYIHQYNYSGKLRFTKTPDSGAIVTDINNSTTWTYYEETFNPPLKCTVGGINTLRWQSSGGTGGRTYVDDIYMDVDVSPDLP